MIEISLIRKTTGKEIVEEYEQIYGSIDKLKRIYKQNKDNMKLYSDLEDWKYFIYHPNEEVEDRKTFLTENLTLGKLEIMILSFIKEKNPSSIRELSRLLDKDISSIQPKIKILEEQGFLSLQDGSKNRKIPVLNYDEISIKI